MVAYIGNDNDLVLPENYKGENYQIGRSAFEGCTSLKSIIIPNFVTGIESYAFEGCTSLTSITISNLVTYIGNYAFYSCTGLTCVTIGKSLTYIGNKAFYSCKNLKTVYNYSTLNIEKGSKDNGYVAYYTTNVINKIPADEYIDDFGFAEINGDSYLVDYKGNDTILTLPEYWRDKNYVIGNYAFKDSVNITNVIIPNSVTGIEYKAFEGCTGLTCVTIGKSVTSIGNYAFYGCDNLDTIYNYSSLNIEKGADSNGYVAYYATDVLNKILADEYIDNFGFAENNGVLYLVDYKGNDANLTLSENYKGKNYGIYNLAFYNNTNIKSITIPNSVTSINENALKGCTSLTELTIQDGNTPLEIQNLQLNDSPIKKLYLGRSGFGKAFQNMSTLKSLTISKYVNKVESEAFKGCTNLIHASIDNLEGDLDLSIFSDCQLRTLTVGANIKNITGHLLKSPIKTIWLANTPPVGSSSAEGVANFVSNNLYRNLYPLWEILEYPLLSSIFEVDGIEYILTNAVNRTCAVLYLHDYQETTELFIKQTVENRGIKLTINEICPYAFYQNDHLNVIAFNNSGKIGKYALHACKNLKTAIVGEEIESIGYWAFSECTGLNNVYLGSNLKEIEQEAFSDCVNVTQLISIAVTPPTCGPQALEDINKWTCTLKVPENSSSVYQTAYQWEDFFFVEYTTPNGNGEYYVTYDEFTKSDSDIPWTPTNFTIVMNDNGTSCYISEMFGIEISDGSLEFIYSDEHCATLQNNRWFFDGDYAYYIFRGNDQTFSPDVKITFDESRGIHFGDLYIAVYCWDSAKGDYVYTNKYCVFKNLIARREADSISEITKDVTEQCTVVDGNIMLSTKQTVQVYNVMGGMVYSGVTSCVDNLPKGIYIVKTKLYTQKIVIK